MASVTRTVLFTDLTGFTQKTADANRAGLRNLLAWHEQVIAPVTARYEGARVVKNLGDSFMLLFPSATDALRAALDIQESVTTEGQGSPLKIGMNTGDVEEIAGDAFGEAANMAKRIVDMTSAGEIWFGAGTRVCMSASEIPWDIVGRFNLKGIPGGQEIFRAVPRHRAWLPDSVSNAARLGNLVRYRRGQKAPMLPPDPVILLEQFVPNSEALEQAVSALPVLDPAALWLCTYNISQSDRQSWSDMGRGLVVGTPTAIDTAIDQAIRAASRTHGSDTIVIDVGTNAEYELVMCGIALPQVPLSEVVASYSYDLMPNGEWVNRSDRAVLRIDISPEGSTLLAMAPGVSVNGRTLHSGESMALEGGARISTSVGVHVYHQFNEGYLGVVVRDSDMRLPVAVGQTAELGREPGHPGLQYPDRRGQDNIRWCVGQRAARAKANGFTLDRALAGRRQAAIQVVGEYAELTPLHDRCPTYVVRHNDGRILRAEVKVPLYPDDLVLAGTSVIGLRSVNR
jgi:class 3 adenylate cyclase